MRWLAAVALAAAVPTAAGRREVRGKQALEPKEDFSAAASQALGNLTAEFARFRGALAGRADALAATLQDQERSNHELELSNLHASQAVDALRKGNGALRARAKALIAGNEELRAELREAKRELQEAQDFSTHSMEGDQVAEARLLADADAPTAAPTSPPERTVATPAVLEDDGSTQAPPQVQAQRQAPKQATAQGPPPSQGESPTEDSGDVGYAEAFASGDADGSSDDVGGSSANEEFSPFESFLALRSRHLRKQRSLADDLPESAETFAKLEKESVEKVQRSFRSAQQRVLGHRGELLGRQGSLNATRKALEATHGRLASVVGALEATHKRLQARSQRLLTLLGRAAGAARAAQKRAAARAQGVAARPTAGAPATAAAERTAAPTV